VAENITIAIDGFSSCGKSTLARALAAKLGYSYVDTGAMYRAVTLYLMRAGVLPTQDDFEARVESHLPGIRVEFRYNNEKKTSETFLNEEPVEKEIRSMAVSELVSKVSLLKSVRQKMVALQKNMGQRKGVVMEGRDIGTNVFPDAELKIFMLADSEVRMQRRFDELHAKGIHISEEEVRKNLASRDYEDTHRKENPLIKAEDAIVLDNSELSRQEQLEFVIRLVHDHRLLNTEEEEKQQKSPR
jgi:cytidylate kinase